MSKHHAVFPPGFTTRAAWHVRLAFALATRSRRIRTSMFELPHSRFRSYWVARYYHRLTEQFSDGDFSFLSSIRDDAQWAVFGMETYLGREGVRRALTEYREMFPSPGWELAEFINPPGPTVLLTLRMAGRGAASGIDFEGVSYLVIEVEDGDSAGGRFFRNRNDALEAAGLSE